MGTARRSLAEDDVDRYNHTWVFYLLLLLSLATWLLPLSLTTHPSGDASGATRLGKTPGYVAQCWTPSQFSEPMVNYAQTVCAASFNKAIRDAVNGPNNKTVSDASLFYIREGIARQEKFEPTVEATNDKKQDGSKNGRTRAEEKHFIFVRTPLILFVLALCLKLPHVAWASFSSCGGRGFSHVLESARAVQVQEEGVRSQFKEELKKAMEQIIKPSSLFRSGLYLLLKVLTLLVSLAGLFIVSCKLLPRTENLYRDLNQRVSAIALGTVTATRYSGTSIYCEWYVRSMQNLLTYTIQCIFTPGISPSTGSSTNKELALVGLYESLSTILVALFAVLATINIMSLLTWTARLAPGSLRKKAFRNASYPTDAYLLLNMANLNAGSLVASYLEGCLVGEAMREWQVGKELANLCD